MTLTFDLGRDFCTLYLTANFDRPTFSPSESGQTNKRPPRFATLRRWVVNGTPQLYLRNGTGYKKKLLNANRNLCVISAEAKVYRLWDYSPQVIVSVVARACDRGLAEDMPQCGPRTKLKLKVIHEISDQYCALYVII